MSKDYGKCIGDVCPNCQRRTWHKWEIDKQRTQLLARVREEIEKSRKKIPNEFYSFRPKDHMTNEEYEKYQYDEGFNLSVEEQLKKLEIISEEGKE